MKRIVHMIGVLALIPVAIATAAGIADATVEEEQTLICACATAQFAAGYLEIDPGFETVWEMASPAYETLTGYDPQGLRKNPPEYTVVPLLAQSIDSTDFITWTVNLRRGIKFHTGNEMQADDVKFSIERVARWEEYVNLETTGEQPFSSLVQPFIDRVEVVDDYTVRIHTTDGKPVPLMLQRLTMGNLAIMDREAVLEHEERGDAGFLWLSAGNSAGTGAYRISSALVGEKITYEKFSDYWGGLAGVKDPFFDKLVMIPVQENGARRLAIEKGVADISTDLPNAMVADMMETGPAGVAYYTAPSFKRWALIMHTAGGPLADVRVRQAIKYAIDYDGLVDLHRGTVSIAQTVALAGLVGYDPELAFFYKRDVAKAKALLAEAGYPEGLEMDLWAHKESLFGVDPPLVIEKLGADLEEVGIKTTLKAPTWRVMFESLYNDDPEAHSPALYFKANGFVFPDVAAPGGIPNFVTHPEQVVKASGWNSQYLPDVDFAFIDDKIEEARATTDSAMRAAAFRDLDRYLLEWANHHPLLQVQTALVYRDDLTGVYWNDFLRTLDWSTIRRQ